MPAGSEHPAQLGHPVLLAWLGQVGQHREGVGQAEGAVGLVEGAVEPVDPEGGERQVRAAPGDQLGVAVGAAERQAVGGQGGPVADHPADAAAEVEHRADARQVQAVAGQDAEDAVGGTPAGGQEPGQVVRAADGVDQPGRGDRRSAPSLGQPDRHAPGVLTDPRRPAPDSAPGPGDHPRRAFLHPCLLRPTNGPPASSHRPAETLCMAKPPGRQFGPARRRPPRLILFAELRRYRPSSIA